VAEHQGVAGLDAVARVDAQVLARRDLMFAHLAHFLPSSSTGWISTMRLPRFRSPTGDAVFLGHDRGITAAGEPRDLCPRAADPR